MSRLLLLAALMTAVVVSGCGLTDPYTTRHTSPAVTRATSATTRARSPVINADPAPEHDGTIPTQARNAADRVGAGAGEPTPQAAIARYATLEINWTAGTVAQRQQQLAGLSI